jgi:CRP/FNR family cyclic AMP-dependent transcriptional regulator
LVPTELLQHFAFFAGLSEGQLRGIAMISEEVSFPAKTVILEEDTEADRFYLIVSGEVELLYRGDRKDYGSAIYVGSVTRGEVLGVSALIDPYRLRTGARTEGQVSAIAISAASLRAMCEEDTGLGYLLLGRLAHALYERLHAMRIHLYSV